MMVLADNGKFTIKNEWMICSGAFIDSQLKNVILSAIENYGTIRI